jgi:hypothetical protein
MKRLVLAAFFLAVAHEAASQSNLGLPPSELDTARGARAWLRRLANPDIQSQADLTSSDHTCGGTSLLFRAADQGFHNAEAVSEFAKFASGEDTLVAWIARARLAQPSERERLQQAMLGSLHLCIRCESVQRIWAAGVDPLGTALEGSEAGALQAAWKRVELGNESFMRAYRKGQYARVMVTTGNSEGYYVYFQHDNAGWSYVCRNSSWIA